MRIHRMIVALAMTLALVACGSQELEDYAAEKPALDLRTYLDGPLTASGIFFDRAGRASVRFVVDMDAKWEGDTGTLDERFLYSDGRTQHRVWTIRFQDDAQFTATAPDVVGEATGAQRGNAATMSYSLKLPRGDGEIVVSMEDWFYLQQDGTLINRATMRKFGVTVGEVLVIFRKAAG